MKLQLFCSSIFQILQNFYFVEISRIPCYIGDARKINNVSCNFFKHICFLSPSLDRYMIAENIDTLFEIQSPFADGIAMTWERAFMYVSIIVM